MLSRWNLLAVLCVSSLLIVAASKRHSQDRSSKSDERGGRSSGSAEAGARQQLQNGREKVEWCRRQKLGAGEIRKSTVCDPDRLLSPAQKQTIKTTLRELEQKTSQQQQQNGLKLPVLVMQNIQDPKETDEAIYELMKQQANQRPGDKAGLLLFAVDSSADGFEQQQRQRQQQKDQRMNTPIYRKMASNSPQQTTWAIFYSTEATNDMVSPSEIDQLFAQKQQQQPQIREAKEYGNVIREIVDEIRNKATSRQSGSSSFNSNNQQFSNGQQNGNTEQKVSECLQQFDDKKVCNPDNLVNKGQEQQVERALNELEYATKETENQKQQLTGRWTTCKRQGPVKIVTIFLREVQNQQAVDQKVAQMLQQREQQNPCDRPAVILLAQGSQQQQGQRQNLQEQNVGGQTVYYYTYSDGTWSKFYGPQNLDIQLSASEFTNFYAQQEPTIRQREYGQALEGLIRALKERSQQQQRRKSRDTSSESTGNGKQARTLMMLEGCLSNIDQPKVCDPTNVLSSDDRNRLQNTLEQIQQQSRKNGKFDQTKKFVTTVVALPYTEDTTQHERKIFERLSQYSKDQKENEAAVMMLAVKRGDNNGPSKFYGGATAEAPVKYNDMLQYYNEQKNDIRTGKHGEAMMKIVDKVRDQTGRQQQFSGSQQFQ